MGKGGENADGQPGKLLANPRFAPLKQDNFNPAEFTSRVLAGSHTTAQAKSEELKESVRLLEGELSDQIIGKHQQLLSTARKVVDTEEAIHEVTASLSTVQLAVKRIRSELVGPYEHVKAQKQKLRNLHSTVDLLRHLIYRLKLMQKLRAQMELQPGAIDLAKAARILTDISSIESTADFTGVQVATADDDYLSTARASICSQSQEALQEGMTSLSQAKVGSALQVFFNLQELQQVVGQVIDGYLGELERSLKASLDQRHLGAGASRGQGATAGTGGSWQEKMWKGLREAGELLSGRGVAVWHLQRVVAKKRDPHTHVLFLDVLLQSNAQQLTQRYWEGVVKVVTEQLTAAARPSKGGAVREALIAGYPQLAALLESCFDRLLTETTMKGVSPAVTGEHLQQLLGAAGPFQGQYLSAALSRMNDAVAGAFASAPRSLPSPADVQACIGCMHEELKAAGSSQHVAAVVASAVGQAVALFAEKAEFMAATGPEVRAMEGPCNAAQARNITLASQMQEVQRSLLGLLARLPESASAALQKPFERLQDTVVEVVAPLMRAALERFEEGVLLLHGEEWGREGGPAGGGVTETSRYMVELVQSIAQFRQEYLSKFVPLPSPSVPSCVAALVQRMAARLLVFFVRHAALVRDLSPAGRLQLAKDAGELQQSVGSSLYPLDHVGPAVKVLRSFRALLFLSAPAILTSPLAKVVPPSAVVHHLFSRLPPAFVAPHERSGLSPIQYSRWLDQHSSLEVLDSVHSAIATVNIDTVVESAGVDGDEVRAAVEVIMQLCKDHGVV